MSQLILDNQASVTTPSAGETTLYVDSSDKLLKSKDDSGAITNYGAPGTSLTALTGEVTAIGPGSAAATVSNAAVIGKVLTGLTLGTGTILSTDTILQAFGKMINKGNASVFPAATDGNATISSDTTLVKDMYYDTLTIDVGATLFTNGFRVFARTAIICNGSIDRSGNNATGTGTTAALPAGTLSGGTTGGAGGTAAGTAGGASATSLGGAGGNGGLGSSGAGGAGGANTLNTAAAGGTEAFQIYDNARNGRNIATTQITNGSGAGGGGGDGTAGGAGGGGGGQIVLVSPSVTGTGTIRAKGGDGFAPVAGNRGGGGGGGGGVIAICSENDVTATSLTVNVAGGVGASGSGTGASGINGSTGRIYYVRV
jgi:hypothetical protein